MASQKKRPIDDQVMVITGASSGIGLATAQAAAALGARVVLAARSGNALQRIVDQINSAGPGQAVSVPCDVALPSDVATLAAAAVGRFSRIDTWVNNAAIAIYGRLDEVSDEDNRRLFDVNFWGLCYGSLMALPYLRQTGGTLINVGSEVSEAVMPLLGMYAASKHAVKGFTDALRVEIEHVDDAEVTVTLIEPSAVDTPFPQHARNYLDGEPQLPEPTISAEKVAEAILEAAVNPTREKKVGSLSLLNTTVAKWLPGLGESMSARMVDNLTADEPPRAPEGALFQASELMGVVGQTRGAASR